MAKKSRRGEKTAAVLEYMDLHPHAMPAEVAAALTKAGMTITAKYVSNVKGKTKGRKGRRKSTKAIAAAIPTTNGGLNLAQVKAAFRFIKECGDTAAAKAALSAAGELKKFVV